MKLQGACAIVTGGADGIGKALVEYFVSKGTKVVFGDISTEKGQEISKRLNQNGKWAVFCVCDVRKESELINLFDVAKREFGGAQILVNNAGIGPFENFTTSTGVIDAIVDINLTAVLKATSLAIQHFQMQRIEKS
ncbi:hypothetical protein DSO57_1006895 [Entomophthora muscae]|uniref:Uncharacterized protein n=1 Tax=Entomophthora muscae TaxID=34485 RepID=A0ACC2U6V2_9FUNG|nr:hypothetical protein DSO57_1006895 [Entomophthora muscae]